MMEALPLFSLFLVALSYGATACMLSCMPILSPILLANNATRQESLRVLIPITAGRISGYTLLAVIAFTGAAFVQSLLKDKVLMGYILGSMTLILALKQLLAIRTKHACCAQTTPPSKSTNITLFATGLFLSMSICAPVATMMTLSATAPSLGWAVLYGLSFGLGATLLWFFFFSVVLTTALKESLNHLSHYRRVIEIMAPILLACVGILIFNGWIRL
ncbi:MAG: sulfite exporter TauE/SafE family protein [Sulfuricurvum sp.]|nr:sulfite exporter TauE/SafE family protein [Sulfuricurvum sp.]